MKIKDATNIYIGSSQVSKIYEGSSQIWPVYVPAQHRSLIKIEDFAEENNLTINSFVPRGTYTLSNSPNININIDSGNNLAIVDNNVYLSPEKIIMRVNTQHTSLTMTFLSNEYLSEIKFNIPCPYPQPSAGQPLSGGPISVNSGTIVYNTADIYNTTVVWTGLTQSVAFDFTSSSEMEFNSLEITTNY